MGKKAEEWSDMTDNSNIKFNVKHPASAAYNGSKWDSNYVFVRISEKIKKLNGNEIIW